MGSKATREGVYYDMTDEVYHEQHSEEEHFFSSSQLKTIIEDPREFKRKYIDGEKDAIPQPMQDAFDVGTVAHTALLEPDKLKQSYVKWTSSGNRTGKVWDDFKEKHKGKLILNKTMVKQAQNAIKSAKNSPLAMSYIDHDNGQAEVSFFVKFMGIRVKVRTDWLGESYILDVKTTSGDVRNEDKIRAKIKKLSYDLSAAFYVDVVNFCIDYFELDIPKVKGFLWLFVSKDKKNNCQVYDAEEYLEMGRAKYKEAIRRIKKHSANGWEFKEEVIKLKPNSYEVGDWVNTNKKNQQEEVDTDLL